MKKIFVIAILTILFGCVYQTKEEIKFEEGYNEIISKEKMYNLSEVEEIKAFKSYLINFKNKIKNETSRDAAALRKFLDFKINLAESQINILLAKKKITKEMGCVEMESLITNLKDAKLNINLTILTLIEFNKTFPEYLNKTKINDTTFSKLNILLEETDKAIKETNVEFVKNCGRWENVWGNVWWT